MPCRKLISARFDFSIVRNTCLSCLRNARARESVLNFDEQIHGLEFEGANPEKSLVGKDEATSLRAYIEALPLEYREAVVMREIQQLSYKEISEITSVSLGTVMSRLPRGRRRLKDLYATRHNGGAK
jgi:RNA polymerase sigma factor (sigma-70 family)